MPESNYRNTKLDFAYPWKNFYFLYGTFFLIIGIFYFLPLPFRYLTMFVLLWLFALSKRNYWWLAFYFIISIGVWGLFTEGTRDASTGFPLISFGRGFSFSFKQAFLFVALFKVVYFKRTFTSYFKKPFIAIFWYFAFLVFLALLMGTSLGVVIDDLKKAVMWGSVIVFPALIKEEAEVFRLIYLILPVVLFVFVDGLYFLFTGGHSIAELFNSLHDVRSVEVLRFQLHGWHGVLLGFIISLALAQIHKSKQFFLYSIAGMAFFVELISGTRSWFIIFLIIAAYTLLKGEKMRTMSIVGGFVMVIALYIVPMTNTSMTVFEGTTERILSVFEINQAGSASNKQIEAKLTQRLPQQLKYIKQNPITGWGFTEKKGDMDVGVIGQLVEMGLIGFFLFIWLWWRYLSLTRSVSKNKYIPKEYRLLLRVFWIGMIGLLISHFTTNQIFGLYYYTLFIAIYFWLTNFFLKQAKQHHGLNQ